jgi:Tol biopolymer transport system component
VLMVESWRAYLYWQSADGSSLMQRLTTSENHQVPGSFSLDGATLAFVEVHADVQQVPDIVSF